MVLYILNEERKPLYKLSGAINLLEIRFKANPKLKPKRVQLLKSKKTFERKDFSLIAGQMIMNEFSQF